MEKEKTQIGIDEIKNIKMTSSEKSQIFENIINSPITSREPIKSPYSFVSIFKKYHLGYYGAIFCIVIILINGKYFSLNNQKAGYSTNVAIMPEILNKNITENNNFKTFNNDTNDLAVNYKKTNSQITENNNKNLGVSSSLTSMSQNNSENINTKIYKGPGFSFSYDRNAKLTSGVIPSYGYYAEISDTNKFNSIHFYFSILPDNFRPEFFTDTTIINGKTFYFGDVQTENGIERSYMYKQDGKTVVIQNNYLIDLSSIEIN